MMPAVEVLRVLDVLAGRSVWIGGGWGVDALAGRETRPHRDLDLALGVDDEEAVLAALARLGYRVETDWRPVRVELAAPGERWVDLHPVAFDETGEGRQAGPDGTSFRYPADCFTTGIVAGRPVPCLSVAQQLVFHAGYPPRPQDLADLAVLRHLRDPSHVAGRED